MQSIIAGMQQCACTMSAILNNCSSQRHVTSSLPLVKAEYPTAMMCSTMAIARKEGRLTIGEGGVGVSELIKEGVSKGANGCHSGHWTVMQQFGHLQAITHILCLQC